MVALTNAFQVIRLVKILMMMMVMTMIMMDDVDAVNDVELVMLRSRKSSANSAPPLGWDVARVMINSIYYHEGTIPWRCQSTKNNCVSKKAYDTAKDHGSYPRK